MTDFNETPNSSVAPNKMLFFSQSASSFTQPDKKNSEKPKKQIIKNLDETINF